MYLETACNSDIVLKCYLRGFKWKIKKKHGKYSPLQRWYCSLADAAKLVPHIKMKDKNSEGTGSWQGGGGMCVNACVCVSRETDRTNTWLHWPNRLNYLAFGSLHPWTCQLVWARRKKTLISDPSPVRCWLIWVHSTALNHWSRLPP